MYHVAYHVASHLYCLVFYMLVCTIYIYESNSVLVANKLVYYYSLSGCLWSVVCRARSSRLATAPLMYAGVIPAITGECSCLSASDTL